MEDNNKESDEMINNKNIISNDCQELANIHYKTMLLKGNTNQISTNNKNIDITSMELLLSKDNEKSSKEPWSKLDQTVKMKKINEYISNLKNEYKLNNDEIKKLEEYLLIALQRKRLQRVKDVIYDKNKGEIKNIPCLIFNNKSRNFTLKRSEKRQSTSKSLGPGKTRKNKEKIDVDIKDNV